MIPIPTSVITGIGAGVIAGLAGYGAGHHLAELAGDARFSKASAEWQTERAKASDAAASASEAYRAKEQAWAASAAQIQKDGEERHAKIAADADRATRAAGSLRQSLTTALNGLRRSASETPATASNCTAAIDAAGMYADMLAGLADRGGKVARLADEAISASQACVGFYGELAR